MRNLIAVPAVLGAIILIGGCASVPEPQGGTVDAAMARQTVKIYDVAPPYASPIEQLTATACNGTTEIATDRLLVQASQRGGNGLTQLSCKAEGMSLHCWSSATCTGTALMVTEPPPRPVAPPKGKPKPKPKKR